MRLFHFLHNNSREFHEFSSWVSLVVRPTCLRIFCCTLVPSRTECTIWTRVRLRSESNFLCMNMAVVIEESGREIEPINLGALQRRLGE